MRFRRCPAPAWASYLLPPLITASAVIETALRILNPIALRVRRLHDHVIVVGAGRIALLYVKRLCEHDPNVAIVVVERDGQQPAGRSSPFASDVAAETGVLPFQLAELVTHSMPRAWFE